MSIRLKLTLWYSGLFAIAFIVFGMTIYSVVYHNSQSELKNRLKQVASDVQLSAGFGEYNLDSASPGFNASFIVIQMIQYKGGDGLVAGKSRNIRGTDVTLPVPKQSEARTRFVNVNVNGLPFLVYEVPVQSRTSPKSSEVQWLLQVGAARTDTEKNLFSNLRGILWETGAAALLAAFLLGLFLSRKALKPIDRVAAAARQIETGSDLGLRLPREKADDEIGRLTDTLNGMLASLEKAYKNLEESNAAQRRFVSDASHELRTPLTTIRGNVDLLEKIWDESAAGDAAGHLSEADRRDMSLESIRDIADEARRMSRLVNDLLALARADAGYAVEMESLQLRPLAEEAARRASFLPRRAEWIAGPLEALDGVWVKGNRDYLLQLLFILIENGFKYTPQGTVRLYASVAGAYVGLTVLDTGIGLWEDQIPHIFERFFRADASRGETSGTGLGLSIARWIADLHHATIDVQSRPGEGSAFTIWLPIGAAPSLPPA